MHNQIAKCNILNVKFTGFVIGKFKGVVYSSKYKTNDSERIEPKSHTIFPSLL